jgi:Ca2+-binding RTX toxin-like protein
MGSPGDYYPAMINQVEKRFMNRVFTLVLAVVPLGLITGGCDLGHERPAYYQMMSVQDAVVDEADGTATFAVTLDNPSSYPVTVDYASGDGTATAGGDYTAVSGMLTFDPGETFKTIAVPVIEDLASEGPETFTVDLSNPVNAVIFDPQGLGTIVDNDTPSLAGIILFNEIGLESLSGSCIEILNTAANASAVTPVEMAELGLIIVGQDGQVIHVSEGFISSTVPANGTMVLYEDGTLEIRNKVGNVKSISAGEANWADDATIYIGGAWVSYDPAVHDFSFGDTTAEPLLVNLLQGGFSIDTFTANNPVANTDVAPGGGDLGVYSGSWYPPAGAAGSFTSFDGFLTDDLLFARVFIDSGSDPFVYEPGEIDSHTAADWTTNSTPTNGALNPTQDLLPPPDVDDGQSVVFGTDGADTFEGEAGPDFLFGEEGDDTLYGGDGYDCLDGGAGDDIIYGGIGDDLLVDADFNTPGSTAIVDGGEGVDAFKFTTADDVASLQLSDQVEVSARLSGVEILDMRDGQMLDSLTVTSDVVNALGVNNDHTSSIFPDIIPPVYDGHVDIYVRGDDGPGAADTVNLQGAGWAIVPDTITLGSEVFSIWADASGGDTAIISIQQGVDVIIMP